MIAALQNIVNELEQLGSAVKASVPNDEPFNVAHQNWSFPGVTRAELIESTEELTSWIKTHPIDSLGVHEARVNDYIRRIQFLRSHTVPQLWGSSGNAVPIYLITLQGLREAIAPALKKSGLTGDEAQKASIRLRSKLTTLELRLTELEPRSVNLAEMVGRIESAYEAADQLPSDLEQLAQDRAKMAEILNVVESERALAFAARQSAEDLKKQLDGSAREAEVVLAQCHLAYAAATSQGLASAFTSRSRSLDMSMWVWVGGFIAALCLGAYFGSERLEQLSLLMKIPGVTAGTTALNLFLAILSVGAPIWFGWLANKQIGQRFRLSEDYAFKAAVSSAYEGYRREAARFDKDMEARLLSTALARLDEQPLRFVEHDSHGSPWHELASSDIVKTAMKSVPGFAEIVRDAAKDAISAMKPLNLKSDTAEKPARPLESKSNGD